MERSPQIIPFVFFLLFRVFKLLEEIGIFIFRTFQGTFELLLDLIVVSVCNFELRTFFFLASQGLCFFSELLSNWRGVK